MTVAPDSGREGGEGRTETGPPEEVDAPAWARLLLAAAPFVLAVAVLFVLWMLG